jgi:hypothetical protein
MRRYRLGLFRPELLIQIFPEEDQNLLAFHESFPFPKSLLADAWL